MSANIYGGTLMKTLIDNKENVEDSGNVFKNFKIYAYGRYGELFTYDKQDNGKYLVNSYEAHYVNQLMSNEEVSHLISIYQIEGVLDFDRNDKERMKSRTNNMNKIFFREYSLYKQAGNHIEEFEEIKHRLFEILKDVERLQLSDEEYIQWFVESYSSSIDTYKSVLLSLRGLLIQETIY